LNFNELIIHLMDRKKVMFSRIQNSLHIDIAFSHIDAVNYYRIDVHVNDYLVNRSHFETAQALLEAFNQHNVEELRYVII